MKMRKYIIILFCFLLTAMLSPAGFAEESEIQQEDPVKITVASGTAFPGREITLPISIEGNTGFTNLAILLEYDESKLTLTGIDTASHEATHLCGTMYHSSNGKWKITENTSGALASQSRPRRAASMRHSSL